MRLDLFFPFFFSAAIHGFLISSEIAECDELGRAADSPPHPHPPTTTHAAFANAPPPPRWSCANSPYCCLMETRSQTNEQPLPGSALQLFINRDAEALMALIFQAKRRLVLAAAPEKRASLHQRRSPRARGQKSSCRCCSAGFGPAAPVVNICASTQSICGSVEVGGKLNSFW